jgi:hypothetical protein
VHREGGIKDDFRKLVFVQRSLIVLHRPLDCCHQQGRFKSPTEDSQHQLCSIPCSPSNFASFAFFA